MLLFSSHTKSRSREEWLKSLKYLKNILLSITKYYSKMLLVIGWTAYTDGKFKLEMGSASFYIIDAFYGHFLQ